MRVLITAGGTREPIDDVRFITNRSSGALGRALAAEARSRGHEVLLLAPEGGDRAFESTADLERELRRAAKLGPWDIVLHSAAVSDYRPEPVKGKIRSDRKELVLRLVRTPKLIARFREWFERAFLVGFKLTSGVKPDLRVRIAGEQIANYGTDLCVENDIAEYGPGEHKARIVSRNEVFDIPKGDKASVARAIMDFVERACSS